MQVDAVLIDRLQNEVKPDEQLLWWGVPNPKRRVKAANPAVATYVVSGTLAIFMIALIIFNIYLFTEESRVSSGPDPFTVFLFIIAIVLLGVNAYRIYTAYTLTHKHATQLQQTIYGITNQRVIVMTLNGQGFAVNSYTASDIGQINRIETGDGWGDVSYGKPRQIQRGGRTLTIVEKMVGIPDAQRAADILTRTFKSPALPPNYPPQPLQ
ncbi:MAG TPA: hypothetical protein VFN35_33875 [Ktedonobacteraceae bacterium]|nr:hypothetical protein [Ktedonobacteraceae bacterium]